MADIEEQKYKNIYKNLINDINTGLRYLSFNHKHIDIIIITKIYQKISKDYQEFSGRTSSIPYNKVSLTNISKKLFFSPWKEISMEKDFRRPYSKQQNSIWSDDNPVIRKHHDSPYIISEKFSGGINRNKRINNRILKKLLKLTKKYVTQVVAKNHIFGKKEEYDSNRSKKHINNIKAIKANHTAWKDLEKSE